MSGEDLTAAWITIQLAGYTTLVLLLIGVPLANWLARSRSVLKPVFETITALPLVLPPTVMGFYFLVLFNPNKPFGSWLAELTGTALVFSFEGLILASVVYSLPFMVQPLQVAFQAIDDREREQAKSLGFNNLQTFIYIVVPQSFRGFITAIVLSFAHTIGEFGIVLLVGGSIPGETRVLSIAIYEHIETIAYGSAHILSLGLVVFAFIVLLCVFLVNQKLPFNRYQ